MSNPSIVWNGNTLSFPNPAEDLQPLRIAKRSIASNGRITTAALSALAWEIQAAVPSITDKDFEALLHAWWVWAAQGKQYSFALDAALIGNQNTTNDKVIGNTSVVVADNSAFSTSDYIQIEHPTLPNAVKVRITSKVGGTIINFTPALQYDMPTGSRVRHPYYWPKVVSLDDEQPWKEQLAASFRFEHRMREDFA